MGEIHRIADGKELLSLRDLRDVSRFQGRRPVHASARIELEQGQVVATAQGYEARVELGFIKKKDLETPLDPDPVLHPFVLVSSLPELLLLLCEDLLLFPHPAFPLLQVPNIPVVPFLVACLHS